MGYNGIMNGVSIGMCLTLGYTLGEYLATADDPNQYCTLGAGNAEVKQSDKGMAGPPMGGGEDEGAEGALRPHSGVPP